MKYRVKKRKQHSHRGEGRPVSRPRRRKKAPTSVDPKLLIRKASDQEVTEFEAPETFQQLPLSRALKQRLDKKGYKLPTEIQYRSLQPLMAKRDLLGIANTGTGKTAAFLIPIIEDLLNGGDSRTLVIVPTRELAQQVEQEFKSITAKLGFYVASFIGGTSVNRDVARLKRGFHLVVGTPGRLMDLANRGDLKLRQFDNLVLDEFDRMLDMGFVKDIMKIVDRMTHRSHTMLFSATLDPSQGALIDQLLHDPIKLQVHAGNATTDNVEQDVIHVPADMDKFEMLMNLISQQEFEKVLIFAETKRLVDRVSRRLLRNGVAVDQIHGNKTQNYRSKALDKFKRGKVKVLVATDVAARGIDVSNITHVINYQIPQSLDSYIHRIGRTGRAGNRGKALTFVDSNH